MKKSIILALSLLTSTSSLICSQAATMEEQARECALSNEDNSRLLCYDRIFRSTQKFTEQKEDMGKWELLEDVSKIDDSKKVFLSLKTENKIFDRFNQEKTVRMTLACRENKTSLFIVFDTFMSDHSHGSVTYRLDKEKAQTIQMRESNNNQALGLWSGGKAIPFIKAMMDNTHLLIQATPHSDSAITAEFDIRGIENAIIPLKQACSW